jgi:PP-loop superfamily ATP-utilizing enzyme
MLFKVLRWKINWKCIWEIVELDEKLGKAYWDKYLMAIKESKAKDQKEIQNKALEPINEWRKFSS